MVSVDSEGIRIVKHYAVPNSQAASFGEVLRHFRRHACMTQEELAEQAGISRFTISALERGTRLLPHKDTLRRLLNALELSAQERERLESAARRVEPESLAGPADDLGCIHLNMASRLIGRATEFSRLQRHVEGEGPRLFLLSGEPGIGKSRLVDEIIAYAAFRGFRILYGACRRQRVQEPYAPVSGALARYLFTQSQVHRQQTMRVLPWLARLLPELTGDLAEPLPTLPATQERRLMFDATAHYLAATDVNPHVVSRGTLLVLDDLQWAGEDALELLTWLARFRSGFPTTRSPFRIVAAYRDAEVPAVDALTTMLADLSPSRLVAQLPMGPLFPAEAAELWDALTARQHKEGSPIPVAAGGVPFYLLSYAQALHAGVTGIPSDVAQSIRSRVAALPPESPTILGVAAVLGQTVRHDMLCAATGHHEEVVARVLDTAHRARLMVVESEYRSHFTYGVIRDVLEQDLGSATRALIRRHLATIEAGDE